jgi:ribonuclease Z
MYADDDDAERARERGHLTASQAAGIAAAARVKRLWLTHVSPSVADLDALEAVARRNFPEACVGRPGLQTSLRFAADSGS